MPTEIQGLRQGLVTLARLSKTGWRMNEDTLWQRFKARMIDDDILSKYWVTEENSLEIPPRDGLYFPLPPFEDYPHLVALLSARWEIRDECAERGAFRLFIVNLSENDPETPPAVFRFDDREKVGHKFIHAQISDSVNPYDRLFRSTSDWLPCEIPRIPIACLEAVGPEGILVCLLASLYGTGSRVFSRVVSSLLDAEARRLARKLSQNE